MLEQSKTELASATRTERSAAEIVAHGYLAAELEQNLIPWDDAVRTVDQRREQNDETWSRAVFAAFKGLRSAKAHGFRLEAASGHSGDAG